VNALRKLAVWIVLATSLFAQSALEQALTLTRQKRYAEASKMIEGVTAPEQPNQRLAFHRLKAAIASGLNDNATAAREMRSALAFAPTDPSLLMATATAEFEANLLDSALQHASRAINLAPDREGYRIMTGFQLIEHQAFQSAIDLLNRSIRVFPQSAKLRITLGIAQYAEGETKDAEFTLEDAIKLDPHAESAYRCLAQIVLQSSAAPPEPVIGSLCAFDPIVCSALQLRVARQNGDSSMEQKAIAGLKLARPDSIVGRCELARAYDWTGRLDEARIQMEQCVRLDPIPQNHYRMAMLYKKLGMNDQARREMELRNQVLQKMSEETALGLKALESSKSTIQ
jgi:tetratricopeptide (TPR) repeat protein